MGRLRPFEVAMRNDENHLHEAFEESENSQPSECAAGFLYQAAKLYERGGDKVKAVHIHEEAGRASKAERLRGIHSHNLDEARPLLDVLVHVDEGALKIIRETAKSSDCLLKARNTTQLLMRRTKRRETAWAGDWPVVAAIYNAAKSTKTAAYIDALRRIETEYRNRGRWVFAAKLYLYAGAFDEFDRLCSEEDELEVAALWYEHANLSERAAEVYQRMGRRLDDQQPASTPAEAAAERGHGKASSQRQARGGSQSAACPACGRETKPHWVECPKCHAELQARCRECGEPLDSDWDACPACRTSVS